MCIVAAYSTVPPLNSTASGMLAPCDRSGTADSRRYVSSVATGEVAANSSTPATRQQHKPPMTWPCRSGSAAAELADADVQTHRRTHLLLQLVQFSVSLGA